MSNSKLRPSSLDYFLAAIAPVFIIAMVGSLVFFILTVFYEGDFLIRNMWILGCYTFASVLIARIAIELGRAQAMTYLVGLGIAVLLVAPRFFTIAGPMSALSYPILIALLALTAFLADRITFDCTSVDTAQDTSGHGLLQSLGLLHNSRRDADGNKVSLKSNRTRKHNPGVWVLYFSLLALPFFGAGQLAIQDPQRSRLAFLLMVGYLLSSMCLLVMISLLSVRSYLRERDIEMERGLAIRWLAIGIAFVSVVIGIFSLLPLPTHSSQLFELPFRITSRDDLQSHKFGWGPEGVPPKDQQGQPQQGQPQQGQPQQGQPQQGQPQQGQPQQGQPQQGQSQQGQSQQGQSQQGQSQQGQSQQGQSQQGQSQKGQSQQGQSQQGQSQQGQSQQGQSQQGQSQQGQSQQGQSQQVQSQQVQSQKNGEQNSEKSDNSQKDANDRNQAAEKGGSEKKNEIVKSDAPRERSDPKQGQKDQKDDAANAKKQEQQQQQKQSDGNGLQKKPNQQKPNSTPPVPPKPTPTPQQWSIEWKFGALFQWIVLSILFVVLAVFGWIHRTALLASLRSSIDWFLAWWRGDREIQTMEINDSGDQANESDSQLSFLSFANPFQSTRRWSNEQIVRQVFRALVAWGREHRLERREDETPEEFVRRLGRRFTEQTELLWNLGLLYGRVAYSRGKVSDVEVAGLPDLWDWMERSSNELAVPAV